eukprot:TRINITY_DN65192_c0_g1_i3.p1 TRINITY_DN65192_c0_g1~~TRINITY_DN65192_c0_g1_i3.p1  ORF type:complete len:157 (-),score=30.50 TRINITY_DN65192_c0_g1_i3:261-731(-)
MLRSLVGSEMCIRDRLEPAGGGRGSTLYELVGVVNHKGHLGAGHYIAYAKNHETSKWLCYNDRVCNEISQDKVITPMAYVLFFERMGAKFPEYHRRQPGMVPGDHGAHLTSCWDSVCCFLCRLSSCCVVTPEQQQKQREHQVEQKVEKFMSQRATA